MNQQELNQDLLEAIQTEDYQNIERLVGQGADINALDAQGYRMLNAAIRLHNINLVKFLVEKGADVNIANPDTGKTLLHEAIDIQQDELAEFLTQNMADLNNVDVNGKTPLHLAAVCNNINIIRTLVSHGASIDVSDVEGQTALHIAAIRSHEDIVKFLVNKGANPNVRDNQGCTPMDLVTHEHDFSAICLLYSVTELKGMANESLFAFIEYNDDIEDNVGKLLELGTAPQKIISGLEILKILKEITRNSNVINVIQDKLLNIIYEVTPSIFRPNKTNIDLLLSDEDKFIALHGMEEKVQSFNHESKAYKALFFLPQIERNPEILQTRRTELLSYPLQLPTNTLEPAKIQTFHNKALVNLIISFTSSQDSKALYLTGKSETDKHLLQEHDSSSLLGYQDEESEVG